MAQQAVIFETGHQEMLHDAQLDYYSKRLATASSDRTIKIFEIAGDKQTLSATLTGHEGPVWQVAWAHPKFGTLLASCGYDAKIIVWKESRPGVWAKLWEDDRHEASVNSIQWAPHNLGLILAAASADGTVSVWTHQDNNTWERDVFHAHKSGCTSVSWGPELKSGSILSSSGNVGSASSSSASSSSSLGSAVFSKRLVTGGCDKAVRIWRFDDQQPQKQQQQQQFQQQQQQQPASSRWVEVKSFENGDNLHKDWVRDVAWAPSLGLPASTIASCSEDKTVIIWMEDNHGVWKKAKVLQFDSKAWRVSWSLMGNILAVTQGDNKVSLWKESVDGDWKNLSAFGQPAAAAAADGGASASAGAAEASAGEHKSL